MTEGHNPKQGQPEKTLREHAHDALFSSRARATITGIVASGIIALVIALVVTGSSGSGSSGKPTAPNAINSAGDLGSYLLTRPIWRTTPTVFGASLSLAFNPPTTADGNTLLLPSDQGVTDAYSTSQVITQGASLAGQAFLIVGQIRDQITSPLDAVDSDWGTVSNPQDVELTGPGGKSVVYGLVDEGAVNNGDVVYFPAVVAAVGVAENGQPTAYVIGLDDPSDTTEYGPSAGSESVPQIAREFGAGNAPGQ